MENVLKHVISGEQALSLFPTTSLGIDPQATANYPVNFYKFTGMHLPGRCAHLASRWALSNMPSHEQMGLNLRASRKIAE